MADCHTSLLKPDQIYLTVTPRTTEGTAVFSLNVLRKDGETPHSDIQRNTIVV